MSLRTNPQPEPMVTLDEIAVEGGGDAALAAESLGITVQLDWAGRMAVPLSRAAEVLAAAKAIGEAESMRQISSIDAQHRAERLSRDAATIVVADPDPAKVAAGRRRVDAIKQGRWTMEGVA